MGQPDDETMGAAESAQIPPNQLVLEKVTPFLDMTALCNARATCTGWKNIFTPAVIRLRRTTPIKLSNKYWPDNFTNYKSMSEFVNVMSASKDLHFYNYDLWLDFSHWQAAIQNFFTPTIGNSIEILKINPDFSSGVDMTMIREGIFSCTPNLAHLELHFNKCTKFGESGPMLPSDLWIDMPNLKHMTVSMDENHPSVPEYDNLLVDLISGASQLEELNLSRQFHSVVLGALRNLGGGGCLATLKALQLRDLSAINVQALLQLCSSDPPTLGLQEFKANVGPALSLGSGHLWQFLAAQAHTLRKLDIYHDLGDPLDPFQEKKIQFPCMAELHTLKYISSPDGPPGVAPVFQLEKQTFMLNFPKLAKLECGSSLNAAGHGTLTSLTWRQFVNSANTLGTLAALFPALKTLNITLKTVDLLPELWTLWPHLRALHVTSGHRDIFGPRPPDPTQMIYIDELITGIPKSQFRFLLREIRDGTAGELNLADLKTGPGITDMKELQQFTLHGQLSEHRWFVTQISEHFGFKAAGSKIWKHVVEHKHNKMG